MTQRMIKFPSIGQYRNVVHTVVSRAQYVGKDANGDATYDTSLPIPTLQFEGTIKLHGTNAGVARDASGEMWAQSRENIITPTQDNAGFAMFVHRETLLFSDLFNVAESIAPITGDQALLIFGEWCGGSIQKKVGLAQLPKTFVVFGIARVEGDGERQWFTKQQIDRVFVHASTDSPNENRIYHIYQFPNYVIDIDFSRPHEAQNKLVELTIEVEKECPVAKQLGATAENGPIIGEGIVWKCITPGYEDSGYWCKVKGELHKHEGSTSKVLTTADVERIDAIKALAVQVTPEWRLEQMLQETFNTLNGGLLDIKRMGDFIKAVMQDVLKEELDVIAASGFTTKDITGAVATIARAYLMGQLEFKEPVSE